MVQLLSLGYCVLAFWSSGLLCFYAAANDNDTLVLVHVLLRHGDRTPDLSNLWKNNPYYSERFYEPFGYAQLTNEGKQRMFKVGTDLRNRYKTFLDDTWNVKIYDAWASNYNRTKMSLALVLAGLFPPEDPVLWNSNFLWQPAPLNALPKSQDLELSSWTCPTVIPLIYNDANNLKRLKNYDGLLEVLRSNTEEDVDYISALDLYFGMLMLTELGFSLPNWTETVFPEPLKTYVVDFYYIETSTTKLKTVIAGYLLKKILDDTQNKINGTLIPQERKIFLYLAHEVNIATMLTSLEAFTLMEPPPYGSYMLFEVHKINNTNGIKLFYQDYTDENPRLVTLPGCTELCPIEEFVKLTTSIIPTSDVECFANRGTYLSPLTYEITVLSWFLVIYNFKIFI